MREVLARLRAEAPELAEATLAHLEATRSRLLALLGADLVRDAARRTHERAAAALAGTGDDLPEAFHVELGAAAARAGLGLDEVAAGYRTGAELAWTRVGEHAAALDAPGSVAFALAERHVAYVDALTRESVEGFARAAGTLRAEQARERQALVEALLAGASRSVLEDRAAAAGWRLPARVVVGLPLGAADTPPADHLLAGRHEGALVLVADAGDPGALRGVVAAVGPAVAPREAAASLQGARRVGSLVAAGALDPDGPLAWTDQLVALVVHGDPAAGAALAADRLGVLDALPPARAAMLRETLAAWLRHPGRPRAIAAELHLHPQTVRYRVARLREAFGDALDDPEERFALDLALRAGVGPGSPPPSPPVTKAATPTVRPGSLAPGRVVR